MKKREYKESRFDWFTVSYSKITAWILIAVVIIGGGLFYYFVVARSSSPEKKAEKEIAQAEALVAEIRSLRPHGKSLIEKPLETLEQAKKYKKERNFSSAISLAEDSQRLFQKILDEIKNEEKGVHKAYLTSIEGRIQVKRKGEVDWIEGKERMALSAGDLVKTGSNSISHIMFFDHTSYILRSNTLIAIQESYEDPFSRARNVLVKLDFGEVDLTTGKKNVPDSISTITSPNTLTVMGEESSGVLRFNRDTSVTSFALYKGSADLDAGGKKVVMKPLEKVNVDKNEKFFSKVKILPAPVLLEPVNERQFLFKNPISGKIAFIWHEVNGAESYNIEISRTSLFANPVLIKRGIKKNKLEVESFEEGVYYWHVSSYAPSMGVSQFSNVQKFRVRKTGTTFTSRDAIPPVLEIEELKVLGNIVLIFGQTEPDVLLTVNSKRVDVENDGTFKDVIELFRLGKNVLSIIAQDPSGNKTDIKKEVYIEEY